MTPTQQRQFVALWRAEPRLRLVDIAARMGVPLSTVSWWRTQLVACGAIRKRHGTKRPMSPTGGQLARLTDIASLRKAGWVWPDVADALEVSTQAAQGFAARHAPEIFCQTSEELEAIADRNAQIVELWNTGRHSFTQVAAEMTNRGYVISRNVVAGIVKRTRDGGNAPVFSCDSTEATRRRNEAIAAR